MTLSVKYVGKFSVHFTETDPLVENTTTVADPAGRVMPVSKAGEKYLSDSKANLYAGVKMTLSPSYSSSTGQLFLGRIYDFSQPGMYKATASRDFTVGPDDHVEHVVSNMVTIEIVPVKPDKPITSK